MDEKAAGQPSPYRSEIRAAVTAHVERLAKLYVNGEALTLQSAHASDLLITLVRAEAELR